MENNRDARTIPTGKERWRMTEQEAIERIYSKLMDGTPKDKDACDIAIDAFEKSYHYRVMERRLKAVYGDCDNLLETVVEGFCRHSGVDIGTPVKSRLLTDEDVDKWDAYRAIGTVEECRQAAEKQKPKKCVEDSCPDHTHYKCPSCGKIQLSTYAHRFSRGRITKYCENCGQALEYEDLSMEKK